MIGFFRRIRALHDHGILGINRRNAEFVLPYNARRHYPNVDDKQRTKRLAASAGIPVPAPLGVIAYNHQLRELAAMLDGLNEFVLKPAHGAQGNGIVVIDNAEDGYYVRSTGTLMHVEEIRQHVSNVLSGLFSFHGDSDQCLIEARVSLHAAFRDVSRYGIPDIRVVVFRGVPVMAMCRLPTAVSGGRANLHQGAIGAGIDMSTGRVVYAEHQNLPVTEHVDTGAPIIGFVVPAWDDVLALAARSSEISELAYLGVDIVMDAQRGPLLLELNARPGLGIQIANSEGLLPRLQRAAALSADAISSWEKRCRIARELFRPASR
jgi:alpha-L-glutamate ligase-like protein